MTDHINKSVDQLRAEIADLKAERARSRGGKKGALTSKIKRLEVALDEIAQQPADGLSTARQAAAKSASRGPAAGTVTPRLKLADLEALVADKLLEQGTTTPTKEQVQAVGGPRVQAGELSGYTAERYGDGAWISPAVLRRITKLLGA